MKQLFPLFSIATLLILSSCSKDLIRGSGSIGSRVVTLDTFADVETHYDIKAVISYGTTQEVTVSGYNNLLDILDFKVEAGVLKLKFNTLYNSIRNGNVVAHIKMPLLSKATIHGSENIEVSGFTQGNLLNAKIHGSGNIKVKNCNYQSALLEVNGNGNIEAQGLQVKETEVLVHGSGNSSVSVSEKLVAKIFGSGNIYYWGNPAVDITRNGNGRVVQR